MVDFHDMRRKTPEESFILPIGEMGDVESVKYYRLRGELLHSYYAAAGSEERFRNVYREGSKYRVYDIVKYSTGSKVRMTYSLSSPLKKIELLKLPPLEGEKHG